MDMCVDMRIDMRTDMRIDMRIDICIHMFIDMCIGMSMGLGRNGHRTFLGHQSSAPGIQHVAVVINGRSARACL